MADELVEARDPVSMEPFSANAQDDDAPLMLGCPHSCSRATLRSVRISAAYGQHVSPHNPLENCVVLIMVGLSSNSSLGLRLVLGLTNFPPGMPCRPRNVQLDF